MRFNQIDQITLLEPGKRIEGILGHLCGRRLFRDHFPRFPVMPGVLMLESLYQASMILVRATENFRSGLVLLREAKNVKFADFVQPGQTLQIVSELMNKETAGELCTQGGWEQTGGDCGLRPLGAGVPHQCRWTTRRNRSIGGQTRQTIDGTTTGPRYCTGLR